MTRRLAILIVACIAVVAGCGSDGGSGSDRMATPGDTSVEAGFARDMSTHHAQAVAMAEAIRDRTDDPDLRLLATDIALGQQSQIGRMTGWLDEWGLSVSSSNEVMAWMDAGMDEEMPGMDMSAGHLDPVTGLMPGMATRPQVSALSTLPVAEAEISFLQLMIAHHTAGSDMAEIVLTLTDHPSVVRLANSMITSQRNEISVMQEMLAKRGVTS